MKRTSSRIKRKPPALPAFQVGTRVRDERGEGYKNGTVESIDGHEVTVRFDDGSSVDCDYGDVLDMIENYNDYVTHFNRANEAYMESLLNEKKTTEEEEGSTNSDNSIDQNDPYFLFALKPSAHEVSRKAIDAENEDSKCEGNNDQVSNGEQEEGNLPDDDNIEDGGPIDESAIIQPSSPVDFLWEAMLENETEQVNENAPFVPTTPVTTNDEQTNNEVEASSSNDGGSQSVRVTPLIKMLTEKCTIED